MDNPDKMQRSAASGRLLFLVATLLAIGAAWFAGQQKPHPDAFRVTPGWLSADFWRYPVEQNAFQRLPKITGRLNDIHAIGQLVWAVGDGGLIIHSDDGGNTWRQQFISQPASTESRSQWNWLGEAWARVDRSNTSGAAQIEAVGPLVTSDGEVKPRVILQEEFNQKNNNQTVQTQTEIQKQNKQPTNHWKLMRRQNHRQMAH